MKQYLIGYIMPLIAAVLMASCHHHKEPEPEVKEDYRRTVLVYAVASNNLQGNLTQDMQEMLKAADNLDTEKYNLVVYKVTLGDDPILVQLVKEEGIAKFVDVKSYDRSVFSTSIERISQVINDVTELYPSDEYGLILWSHSTAWLPAPASASKAPVCYSFGQDKTDNGVGYANVTDLATAIPDHLFSFIWFDSCYMSNIETAYELRNKCDTYIGYATEIWDEGSPYDLTLPCIMREKPDFAAAVKASYDYFQTRREPYRSYTGCVIDMRQMPELADAARGVLHGTRHLSSTSMLQRYSRNLSPVLFDFGQYVCERGTQNDVAQELIDNFKAALDRLVVYKVCSEKNFSNQPIVPENFCGITTNAYAPGSKSDSFYRTLAWYRHIYE